MTTRSTTRLIKEEHGVRLEFCDVPPEPASGTGGPHFRITTRRRQAARVRADRDDAERVWAAEVEASRQDPMVARILAAGL